MGKDRQTPVTRKWVIERISVLQPSYVTHRGTRFSKTRRYRHYLQKGSKGLLTRWVLDLRRALVLNTHVTAWRHLRRLPTSNELIRKMLQGETIQRARQMTQHEMRVYLGRVIQQGE